MSCLIRTRREVIHAHLARASSACMQSRALLLPSVSSSNLGFAVLLLLMRIHCLKKNINVSKYSEHLLDQGEKSSKHLGGSVGCKYKTSPRRCLTLGIRYKPTCGLKLDRTKPNQIGNTVGEKNRENIQKKAEKKIARRAGRSGGPDCDLETF